MMRIRLWAILEEAHFAHRFLINTAIFWFRGLITSPLSMKRRISQEAVLLGSIPQIPTELSLIGHSQQWTEHPTLEII
jgi:hypothetical protein